MTRAAWARWAFGLAAAAMWSGGCRQILGLPDEGYVRPAGDGGGGAGGQGGATTTVGPGSTTTTVGPSTTTTVGPGGGQGGGGGPAGGCPEGEPDGGQACDSPGLVCNYSNECCTNIVYECFGTTWDTTQSDCQIFGECPTLPAEGTSCACYAVSFCEYNDGCVEATCSDGTWSLAEDPSCF